MLFTGILLVIFAISIGYATFIENDFGTTTAKILIYNSWWFEILLFVICLNLIGSIIENKLVSKKKWTIFLFHVAFIFIISGAAITRYYGYEGVLHIREGESTSQMLSDASYVQIEASDGNQLVETSNEVKFSPYTTNSFSQSLTLNGKKIHVKNLQFISAAIEEVTIDPAGEPIVSLIAVGNDRQRIDFNLKEGDIKSIGNVSFGFGDTPHSTEIHFNLSNGKLFLTATDSIFISQMMQQSVETVSPNSATEINTQKVYSTNSIDFAVKQFLEKGKTQLTFNQSQNGMSASDAMQVEVRVENQLKQLNVFGKKGIVSKPYSVTIDGIKVSVSYGSKIIPLPFSLALKDFQLERYPGSNSPSSYASEVVLKDGSYEKPFRIFMNNILKYKGYRFFQSSYDTDEKGTILSVTHDGLGTSITYFGYLIMAIGMILTLFNKNSRFKKLLRTSASLREERKKLFALLIFGFVFTFNTSAQFPGNSVNEDHASQFEKLLIQSNKGRVEPASTLASEILRKVAKKNSWNGMSAPAVFLDMQANPEKWKNIPFIKIGNPELRKMLGINGKYAYFNQIITPKEMGGYKLSSMVSVAYEKPANERNKFDKEVMNVDERVNILMNVFTGNFLTIFPIPNHSNQKWVSANDASQLGLDNEKFARESVNNYLSAVTNGDWATANQLLKTLEDYQQKQGAQIIPAKAKIILEVLYNKLNIFGKLSKIYMLLGLVLLILQLSTIFNPNLKFTGLRKVAFILILLLFICHTAGLGIRWYISGHAPWSNGYESMVFVSWATCLAGLLFSKRSEITLSLTTVLAGLSLMVAGMSWMSPEITNLVPVLKSYWLIVHVAVITSSYGFLGIGALLGLLNLILMISRNKKNMLRVNFTIKELVNITEITLMTGLLLLTAGAFIGGVWANESWGRYWGWDPKETWALVTILVYTFIGHMHKIPGFKGHFPMSAGALLGFSSVLMTYFGVNYYLSGLHSYAQGEPAPIPAGVYIAIAVVLIITITAYFSEKLAKQTEEKEKKQGE